MSLVTFSNIHVDGLFACHEWIEGGFHQTGLEVNYIYIVEKNLEYTTLNFSISQRRNSLKIGDTTKDFIKLKILQRKLSTFTNTQHSRLKLHIRLSLLNDLQGLRAWVFIASYMRYTPHIYLN
jgi:hypothetical protein